jgi:hypothetical protein
MASPRPIFAPAEREAAAGGIGGGGEEDGNGYGGVEVAIDDARDIFVDELFGAYNEDPGAIVCEVIIVTISVEKPDVMMLIAPFLESYVRMGTRIVLVNSE